jgi:hypothetical protein
VEFIVGAIVAFFLLRAVGGTGLSLPSLSNTTSTPNVAPTPVGAPASGTFATQEVQQSTTLQTNTATLVKTATTATSAIGAAAGVGSAFATAIPVVGAVVGVVANILLAQHTARLKGAIAENQLIPATVQAFDADIQELVAAYNGGQVVVESNGSCPAAATAVQQMATSLYSYMKGNATGPGRAWTDNQGGTNPISTSQSPSCNKACTAECCIFYNDMNNILHVLYLFFTSGGSFSEAHGALTVSDGPPSWTFTVPEVVQPPAQYGTFSRASYQITLTIPGNAQAVA